MWWCFTDNHESSLTSSQRRTGNKSITTKNVHPRQPAILKTGIKVPQVSTKTPKNSGQFCAWAGERHFGAAPSPCFLRLRCTPHTTLPRACCCGQLQAKLVLKCKAVTQVAMLSLALNWKKPSAHGSDPELELIWSQLNTSPWVDTAFR